MYRVKVSDAGNEVRAPENPNGAESDKQEKQPKNRGRIFGGRKAKF